MKVVSTEALTKLIQLVKSAFIKVDDVVEVTEIETETPSEVELATVATSGSYNDLSNKPTIPTVNNATLTIQKNGTNVATFTANASSNVTANISVPVVTSTYTATGTDAVNGKAVSNAIATKQDTLVSGTNIKTVGGTSLLGSGNIALPTVNNATLTIQKNGTNVATFTANASSNVTANISVPNTTSSVTSGSTAALTSGGAYTNLVRRKSTSAATGSASQGVYVDANGQVQTCTAVTSTYAATGTAPVNGVAVSNAIATKQDNLVSGTNIKTINNTSILGSGNIDIQGGGSSYTAGDGIDITNGVISAKIATSISSTSTNEQSVGAKLFYDTVGDIETLINAL